MSLSAAWFDSTATGVIPRSLSVAMMLSRPFDPYSSATCRIATLLFLSLSSANSVTARLAVRRGFEPEQVGAPLPVMLRALATVVPRSSPCRAPAPAAAPGPRAR